MSCDVNSMQYDLHMYKDYPASAESCWENPNIYLVEVDAHGKPSKTKVSNPVTGVKYFFAGRVTSNKKPVPKVTQMQFGAPTWMEDGTTEVKTIVFDGVGVGLPNDPSRVYHSKDAIEFLHQGNYEIFAQVREWINIPDDQRQTDWPKKGSLYARDSVFVNKA